MSDVAPVQKMPTGINGFDEMTHGGLPRGRTTLVVGGSGCGKTVFALQTLVNGARDLGEPGIFVAFEETSRQIIANAASFGWDLPALEQAQLFFLDARLDPDVIKTGDFDLSGMLAGLKAHAEAMGARRIVFDSVDVLLSLLDNRLAERQELYRIHNWLTESNLTGLLTTRLEYDLAASMQPFGFLQYMSDCVVLLQHNFVERVSARGVRVVKYRGAAFAENDFPLVIGPHGLEVASFALDVQDYPVFTERISTGISRLDAMLTGGYYRGTSVLITGAPGTAKSTLGAAFIEATCRRHERALYLSFDESGHEIVRNVASVNIQLGPYVQSGLLKIIAARTEAQSAESHMIQLKEALLEHAPQCVVIDPISAIVKAGGFTMGFAVAQRLLRLCKTKGITVVCTSLLDSADPDAESTPIQISTIADTWIHLSYVVRSGERNRALTIVKSRGTGHSAQVRELLLSDDGVSLADVYTAGGEVLMGTLRWEREQADEIEQARIRAEVEVKRRELARAEAEVNAQAEVLRRELDARRAELERLQLEEKARETRLAQRRTTMQLRRGADQHSDTPDEPSGGGHAAAG